MDAKLVEAMLEKGTLGVVIIAMAIVIVKLWNKYNEVQEKRIAESREGIKAVEQNTNTLETMTAVLRERG